MHLTRVRGPLEEARPLHTGELCSGKLSLDRRRILDVSEVDGDALLMMAGDAGAQAAQNTSDPTGGPLTMEVEAPLIETSRILTSMGIPLGSVKMVSIFEGTMRLCRRASGMPRVRRLMSQVS